MNIESEDKALKRIMIISFIGLIDAIYLSYLHHLVSAGGGCPTQDLPGLDCGVVLASDQAKLLGIPVAWLGVIGFLMLIFLSLDLYLNMDLERTYYNKILLPITGFIGVIFGLYLTYAEAFIIHQWCPFCLIAFGLTMAATFFAVKTYGFGIRELWELLTLTTVKKMELADASSQDITLPSKINKPSSLDNVPAKTTNIYISDSIINRSKIGHHIEEEE